MAVEDEDLRDREIWAAVARGWYTNANNLIPHVGRLYHHLAILSRHNPVQQLHFYSRSLIAVLPFLSTRDSVLTLMDPIVNGTSTTVASPEDKAFIKTHAMLLKRVQLDSVEAAKGEFLNLLEDRLNGESDWISRGTYMAIACIAAVFEYGSDVSVLRRMYDVRAKRRAEKQKAATQPPTVTSMEHGVQNLKIQQPDESSRPAFAAALSLNRDMFRVVAQHKSRADILAFVHLQLVFVLSMAKVLEESGEVSNVYDANTYYTAIPWPELADLLNHASSTLPGSARARATHTRLDFLTTIPTESIIPDDSFLRGLAITKEVYPDGIDAKILEVPEEERLLEKRGTARARLERVLHFGIQIASAAGPSTPGAKTFQTLMPPRSFPSICYITKKPADGPFRSMGRLNTRPGRVGGNLSFCLLCHLPLNSLVRSN